MDTEMYETSTAVLDRLDAIHNRLERIDIRFEGVVAEKFKLDPPATNRKPEVLSFLQAKYIKWKDAPGISLLEYLTDALLAADPNVLRGRV